MAGPARTRDNQTRDDQTRGNDARAKPTARQRLLDAASELFYTEGVQTVGIDRIIEQAGVAKATLYNTFGSKEKLVEAYLQARHADTTAGLSHAVERQHEPRARLLAVFDAQAELFRQPDFRGCAFITASAEAPPGGLIQRATDDYRTDIRSLFGQLAAELEVPDADSLARQLQLIYDGAGLAARMDRDPSIAAAARAAAETLLDAACGNHRLS
ncbi:MAG TPA: TetR/AcrR family transcriptional regulator [Pseudonocardia sp.]|jgi:AcrR family transcriptional regulator|nr:TetR/AcrR family transcriptional regulator [Pseudonocardia sp.]